MRGAATATVLRSLTVSHERPVTESIRLGVERSGTRSVMGNVQQRKT